MFASGGVPLTARVRPAIPADAKSSFHVWNLVCNGCSLGTAIGKQGSFLQDDPSACARREGGDRCAGGSDSARAVDPGPRVTCREGEPALLRVVRRRAGRRAGLQPLRARRRTMEHPPGQRAARGCVARRDYRIASRSSAISPAAAAAPRPFTRDRSPIPRPMRGSCSSSRTRPPGRKPASTSSWASSSINCAGRSPRSPTGFTCSPPTRRTPSSRNRGLPRSARPSKPRRGSWTTFARRARSTRSRGPVAPRRRLGAGPPARPRRSRRRQRRRTPAA